MNIRKIQGGVTAPLGFSAAGTAAGIKKNGAADMAMLCSETVCMAAGTFTTNVVKAAPVVYDARIIHETGKAQAVVINSGVANACTGRQGMEYCEQIADRAAGALKIAPEHVLTASTGVIGRQLPMDKITAGIDALAGMLEPSEAAGTAAARAIMTTDTVKKEAAVSFMIGEKVVTIGGMSKGSGMIHPNMCTMLAFLTTDAQIAPSLLQKALTQSVNKSFNMISVDGDTSTNDTCILLANGKADNICIDDPASEAYAVFAAALDEVTIDLARHMAADGEGATALLEVKIVGAETKTQAVTLSKSVIGSSLVKTAIAGHDANWGRILCAMGYSGADFDPEKVDLYFESSAGKLKIIENGVDTGYSEELATEILSQKEITVTADIKMGQESATAWGCDLTHEYISINADYRS